jgi:Ankyrin repeats (3 copies)/Ankyrin repeats (many copies)
MTRPTTDWAAFQHQLACTKWVHLLAPFVLVLVILQPLTVAAHETDQYTLPLGREFADLGPYFSRIVHDAVVEAMTANNAAIKRSLHDGRPTNRTLRLQSAESISGEVYGKLFAAFPTNEILDANLSRELLRTRYPGLIVRYAPEQSIYDDPLLLLDLTKVIRVLFRASTVSVDGKLFGTDKIIHFTNLGRILHSGYLAARKQGLGEYEAIAHALTITREDFFLSEDWMLGGLTTGIHSNADLAADYAGFKFFRNVTEEVRIGNRVMPPMLVRDGFYWRLNAHVKPDSDFFTAFITPHWNEALNPNVYSVVSRARLRAILRGRCPDVLDWYRDERGRRLTRDQFARIEAELSTFYGEDYGYASDGENTVSMATTCFESAPSAGVQEASARADWEDLLDQNAFGLQRGWWQDAAAQRSSASHELQASTADALGRTPLWWAAKNGRVDQVERLLARGADPNAADIDGETPLHAAARWGRVEVVEVLVAHRANPGVKALYGVTPLQVAVMEAQAGAARALLRGRADVNARDLFGASALHDAVLRGNLELTALLLEFGADSAVVDDNGSTPLYLATRAGNDALVQMLSSHATSAGAGNRNGGSAPPCPGPKQQGKGRTCTN